MALIDHFTKDMRTLTHVTTTTTKNSYGENEPSGSESSISGLLLPKSSTGREKSLDGGVNYNSYSHVLYVAKDSGIAKNDYIKDGTTKYKVVLSIQQYGAKGVYDHDRILLMLHI